MAVTDEQIGFIEDLFADIGPITTRKMFGGLGIYADGLIFALLMSDGTIKLKGVGDMTTRFDAAGWSQWTYARKDGAMSSMPYWTLPEALLDDPESVCDWARQALRHLA